MQTSKALRHCIIWAIGELLVPLCDISLYRRADILAGARRLKRRLDVLFLDEKLFNFRLSGALHHGLNFGTAGLLVFIGQL